MNDLQKIRTDIVTECALTYARHIEHQLGCFIDRHDTGLDTPAQFAGNVYRAMTHQTIEHSEVLNMLEKLSAMEGYQAGVEKAELGDSE